MKTEYKTHQVIMLPTEENTTGNIIMKSLNDDFSLAINSTCSGLLLSKSNKHWQLQHLYILSDEEIKEGDKPCWCYNSIKNTWNDDIIYYQGAMPLYHYRGFKKIIATTDISLSIQFMTSQGNLYNESLLQIPKDFIEYFIKEYNKGNILTEVNVEYELYHGTKTSIAEINTISGDGSLDWKGVGDYRDIRLKISKDNTVSILPVKTSYTYEDVIHALAYGYKGRMQGLAHHDVLLNYKKDILNK